MVFFTLTHLFKVADTLHPPWIEDQRQVWKGTQFVVWTLSDHAGIDPVDLDKTATPRVKSIEKFKESRELLDASKRLKCPATCSGMRLPKELCEHVFASKCEHLVTPAHYVQDCGLKPPVDMQNFADLPGSRMEKSSIHSTCVASEGIFSYIFTPEVLVNCWLLLAHAKSWGESLHPLILAACRIAMSPRILRRFKQTWPLTVCVCPVVL